MTGPATSRPSAGDPDGGTEKRPSRRILLAAATAVAAGAVGAAGAAVTGSVRHRGCGRRPGDDLAVLMNEDITPGRPRREMARSWRGDEGRRIDLSEMPDRTDLMRAELAVLAQTGSCQYDLVTIDVAWMAEIVEHGLFQELRNGTSGLLPFAVETGQVEGTQYTVPFITDAALLYYRRDLLGERPLPRTFQAAVDEGNRLKDRLQADNAVGFAGQFADYEGLTVNALEAIWSMGGDELDFTGKGRAARNTRAALDHLVQSIAASDVLAETDEQASVDAFREGRAVFLRNWPFAFHQLFDSPLLKGKLGVTALPWPSVLGGHNLGITAGVTGPRRDQAQSFIEYLTSTDNQNRLLVRGGNAPVRRSAYRNPQCGPRNSLTEEVSTPGCGRLGLLASELMTSLENARSRPRTAWYSLYSRALRRHLYPALSVGGPLNFKELQEDVDAVVGSGS